MIENYYQYLNNILLVSFAFFLGLVIGLSNKINKEGFKKMENETDFIDEKIKIFEKKIINIEEKITFILSEHYKTLEMFDKQQKVNDRILEILKELKENEVKNW